MSLSCGVKYIGVFQYSMTKTGLEFEISVIVICLIFVICLLEFLFRQCSLLLTTHRLLIFALANISPSTDLKSSRLSP